MHLNVSSDISDNLWRLNKKLKVASWFVRHLKHLFMHLPLYLWLQGAINFKIVFHVNWKFLKFPMKIESFSVECDHL